jgi:hypothetical protein
MDIAKCKALKSELASLAEPQIVSIDRFLDGNDDQGSIGCNLLEHPGVDAFRSIFADLLARADVRAIYAQITELDPGDDSWPFTDTVLVVGSISADELKLALGTLQPDEVGPGDADFLSPSLSTADEQSTLVAWWD